MTKDYFEGLTTHKELYSIQIEEKIHDEMPKYERNLSLEEIFSGKAEYSFQPDAITKEFALKEKFNYIGMFCFVSWKWINPFAEWIGERKVLEVMAGRGWLSHGLREKGIDVIATDDMSWHKELQFQKWNDLVTEVENLDAVESVRKYGKSIDILVMAWPYMDNTAYQVIKELHKINPDALVVYCGEWGGCTADDAFIDHFKRVSDENFSENVSRNYQSWSGIHDRLYLGRYDGVDDNQD